MLVAHYRQALTLGRRIRESERLWEAIDGDRVRSGLDERNMGSLYNAAVGLRVRRPDHIEYADVSERVATSDLKDGRSQIPESSWRTARSLLHRE